MKRILVIAAVLVAVAAAGWTGFWVWAKGRLADGIDAHLAALAESRGMEIAYQSKQVGGFPFALEATLSGLTMTKPDWGASMALETVTSRAGIFAPETIETRLPAEIRITVAAGMPRADGTVETFDIDLVSEAMVLTVMPGADGTREMRLTADSIVVVPAEPDPSRNLGFEVVALDLVSRADAQGLETSHARMDQLGLLASMPAPGGAHILTVDWVLSGIDLKTQGALGDATDAEMLLNGVGAFVASLDAGTSDFALFADGATPEESGAINIVQSRVQGALELDGGILSIGGSSQELAIGLLPAIEEGKVHGTIRVPEARGKLVMPLSPGEDFRDFAVNLSLSGITGDEAFWGSLDPAGRLLRDPAKLVAELDGTVRVTKSLAAMRFGEAPPFEFGNLSVRQAEVSLLGARAEAEGDIEFLQPIALPQGQLDLRLHRVLEVADMLVAAGMLEGVRRDVLVGYGSLYAEAGPTGQDLVTEVVFGPTGISVNGLPLADPSGPMDLPDHGAPLGPDAPGLPMPFDPEAPVLPQSVPGSLPGSLPADPDR